MAAQLQILGMNIGYDIGYRRYTLSPDKAARCNALKPSETHQIHRSTFQHFLLSCADRCHLF